MATKAEQIAPLLKAAVAARITAHESIAIEELLAGDSAPEAERVRIEAIVSEFVDDSANDFTTAEGFGVEDAEALLEDLLQEN